MKHPLTDVMQSIQGWAGKTTNAAFRADADGWIEVIGRQVDLDLQAADAMQRLVNGNPRYEEQWAHLRETLNVPGEGEMPRGDVLAQAQAVIDTFLKMVEAEQAA